MRLSPVHSIQSRDSADDFIDFASSPQPVSPPSVGAVSISSDNPQSPMGVVPDNAHSPVTATFTLDQYSLRQSTGDTPVANTIPSTEVKVENLDLENQVFDIE